MFRKLLATIRDIGLFCLLLFLIQIAVQDTQSYIMEHKKSMIHELDRTFIDQLYTAQRQLHILQEHPMVSDIHVTTLADLKTRLATIEEQYKKNSPGLALLGPIGTAAIVTKEEQLAKKLLLTVHDIGNVLHHMSHASEIFSPASSISDGLAYNKNAIKTLRA